LLPANWNALPAAYRLVGRSMFNHCRINETFGPGFPLEIEKRENSTNRNAEHSRKS
jgi:hypothetical protein